MRYADGRQEGSRRPAATGSVLFLHGPRFVPEEVPPHRRSGHIAPGMSGSRTIFGV